MLTTYFQPTLLCSPPEGKKNTVGDGVCGENGNFQLIEDFGVSSYEKDGIINLIWKNQGPGSDEISGPPHAGTSTLAPADEFGVFVYTDMGYFTAAETFTFTGEDKHYLLGTATATTNQPMDEEFERIVITSLAPRMDDETAFLSELRQAFEDHKVKAIPGWLSGGEPIPNCAAQPWGKCPSEKEWCGAGQDPSCSGKWPSFFDDWILLLLLLLYQNLIFSSCYSICLNIESIALSGTSSLLKWVGNHVSGSHCNTRFACSGGRLFYLRYSPPVETLPDEVRGANRGGHWARGKHFAART